MSQRFRRREIDREGVCLSYLDDDSAGPVVLVLHGLAGTGDEFIGADALSRSWAAHLEPTAGGGLVPPFDADVMEAIMTGVAEPPWERWRSVKAPVTAVFVFSPEEQAEFVAPRPATRHVVLRSGSHDAHLDATAEWATVLRGALDGN